MLSPLELRGVAAMGLTAATSGFLVVLLCAPGLLGQVLKCTSNQSCALKGSTMDVSCTYTYLSGSTVDQRFWTCHDIPQDIREHPEYAGRVEYICGDSNTCTLRITDLRESDGGHYHFRLKTKNPVHSFLGNRVSLTVTDVQMQVTSTNVDLSQNEAELKCVSSCSPAGPVSFIWVKNGQRHRGETFSGRFLPGEEIYCALDGHEDYRSPSLYAPEEPSVNASVSPDDIIEGRSVTLSCGGNRDTVKISWHKKDGDADIRTVGAEPQLVFESIKSSDSGEYYCRAESQLGNRSSESISVEVKYPPRLSSVFMVPSGGVTLGSTVTVTCSSDANPAANYSWFKKNESLPRASGHTFIINNYTADHIGDYYCEATNSRGSQRVGFSLPLVSVPDTWKHIVGGTAAVGVSLVAILVAVFMWIRRKRQTSNEIEQRPAPTQQDHVRYASINFSERSEAHGLYSNTATAGLQTRQPQQEDAVEYAAVQLSAGSSAPRNGRVDTAQDPSALYSTVNKTSASGGNHR